MGLLDTLAGGLDMGLRAQYEDIKEESALQRQVELYKQKLGLESEQKLKDEDTMFARTKQRNTERNAKIEAMAKSMGGEDMANLDKAKQTYREWGGEGADKGVAAVEAQQGLLTQKNLAMAAAMESGDYKGIHQMGRDEKSDARQEFNDAYNREKDRNDFALREKQVNATIQASQRAADEALQKKSDRDNVKSIFNNLNAVVSQAREKGVEPYRYQIDSYLLELQSYGQDTRNLQISIYGAPVKSTEKTVVEGPEFGKKKETSREVMAPASSGGMVHGEKPTKQTIETLPPGAKKIGTSGGKDVYELPDGTRVVAK